MRRYILTFILLLACSSTIIIAYPRATEAPKHLFLNIATPCMAPNDTSVIQATWSPVLDRRGAAVDHYNYRFFSNSVVFANDTTSQTLVTVNRVCPIYGDSLIIVAEVWAVDNRGQAGDIGRSNNLIIKTPDRGPIAPEVTIDTLAVNFDSLTLFAVGDPAVVNRFITEQTIGVGEELQFCPVFWKGDNSFIHPEYVNICTTSTGFLKPKATPYKSQRFAD